MIYAVMFLIGIAAILIWRYFDEPYRTNNTEFTSGVGIGVCIVMMTMCIVYGLSGFNPSVQDVVNKKTTFKITYIDNVPTDTTIVYKKGYGGINWW